MFYAILLSAHLVAAAASVGIVGYALYALFKQRTTHYRPVALGLGALAGFEIATGTLLASISTELLAVSLTLHIVAYVGVCLATEGLLFVRMRGTTLTFPALPVLSPVFASVGLFIAAVSFGF